MAPPAEGGTVEQGLAAAEAHIAAHRTAEEHHIAEVQRTAVETSTAVEQQRQVARRVADNSLGPVAHILAEHNPAEEDSTVADIQALADILDTAFGRASDFQRRTVQEN